MSTVLLQSSAKRPAELALGFGAALFVAAVAMLAGWAPIGFSIATVFLFAGPHNWIEVRYFLGRLPARWGRLRGYFTLGFLGVFLLTAAFAGLPWLIDAFDAGPTVWLASLATWNTLLILWILTLASLRSRQNPRRDWGWLWPIGLLLITLTWIAPTLWSIGLVYAHPLMALWILDRELRRTHSPWRGTYHRCLLLLPVAATAIWLRLAHAPDLPGRDFLHLRIIEHAGGGILAGVSTHFLVALHTFLEMIHYGVWLVVLPLALPLGRRGFTDLPLARRSLSWRRFVIALFAAGAVAVVLLWGCFLANYPLTRDVYFTVAMLHVLAEAPFLLRAL